MSLLHTILGTLRRLRASERGNVLLLFGLSIIPLTFATGMGIDYSMAMRLETRLNAAADAAALASTTTPMLNKTMSQACSAALAMFRLQSSNLAGLTLNTNDATQFSVVVTETYANSATQTGTCGSLSQALAGSLLTPLSRVTTVTYRGQSANTFSGILGKPTLTVTGIASTKVSVAPYIDIHMALDTSQSMGLAATDADALRLYTATGQANGTANSCTFGCHAYSIENTSNAPTGSTNGPNASYRAANDAIASYAGVTLRIDVLKQATQTMIASALTNEGTSQLYRFALYRIGATTSTIAPLSTDIATTSRTVGGLTLGPNTAAGTGDTNLTDMTNYILPRITVHGDGTTQARARAFLFIVTDGVSDLTGSCPPTGHCTTTISPATCQAYKDANITVGVVYTTYLPVKADPTNPSNTALDYRYNALIAPLPPATIGTQLQACASPGWFFQASDGPSIHTAMQNLFSQASQTPVITH